MTCAGALRCFIIVPLSATLMHGCTNHMCARVSAARLVYSAEARRNADGWVMPLPVIIIPGEGGTVYRDYLVGLELEECIADGQNIEPVLRDVSYYDFDLTTRAAARDGHCYSLLLETGEDRETLQFGTLTHFTPDTYGTTTTFVVPRNFHELIIRYHPRLPGGDTGPPAELRVIAR